MVKNPPTQEEINAMSWEEWQRFVLLHIDGGDWKHAEVSGMLAGYEQAGKETAERAATNARKPRPSRQHPRKDEAMRAGLNLYGRRPDLSLTAVATQVAARMDGEGIPSALTIRDWLSKKLKS
ncbi:hypothetical protein [Sulfitobacter sp. JL08]|uniref:hypothetical protein n=1 Tax=Sulfitobacter sp. JL08 TaxID=2070369 RepID=UPI0013B418C6|nr:hypothetical protein [Sulfitobacter sp. JL08]